MGQILKHPVVEQIYEEEVTIYYKKEPVTGRKGQTVAAILTAAGIKTFRHTEKRKEPRGLFCGIGQCGNCMMRVNGKADVRVCVTEAEDGMQIEEQ